MKANQEKFEILIVSLFYLLSRFENRKSAVKAEHIVEHLQLLLSEPKVRQSALMRSSCETLLAEWRNAIGSDLDGRFATQLLAGTVFN